MAYNPLLYPIDLMRKPLFGELPAMADWTHTLTLLGVGVVVSLLVYAPTRRRIVFWL
jgi:ABC-type polysaccharide/polyol phosphate export permease